jgi:D-aspartate ligase
MAVIAGAFQTGILAVRNLKRNGVRALCFDSDARLQGFHSVYGPARLCPDPDTHVEAWLEFMQDLSSELGDRAILIPSSDRYVSAIARNREKLAGLFDLCHGIELQGLLAEKQSQYRLALDHGMPMSNTGFITCKEDLEQFSSTADYPCVLKPRHFREWERLDPSHPLLNQKVSVCNTADELIDGYMSVREETRDVIVQEVIQGPDTNKRVYLAYYNERSERIAHAMFRELRCVPFGFGPATVSEPVVDEDADRVCNDFLRSIKYRGICEIEVKRDSRDGEVKLIEANPRLSGGGDAAPYAGVDLVWIHYQNMVGADLQPIEPNGKHFKHIVLRGEGVAIPEYMRAGLLSWRGLLNSYKPPLAFYDLEWRDWRISCETLYVFLRTLIVRLVRGPRRDREGPKKNGSP